MASLKTLRTKFAQRRTFSIELSDCTDSEDETSSETSEILPTQSPTRSSSPSDHPSQEQTKTSGTSGTSFLRVNARSFGKLPNPGAPEYKLQLAVNIHLRSKMPKPPDPGTEEYEQKLNRTIEKVAIETRKIQNKRRRTKLVDEPTKRERIKPIQTMPSEAAIRWVASLNWVPKQLGLSSSKRL